MASKTRKCRRCGWTHADDYDGCLKPASKRRLPTDTERLTWLCNSWLLKSAGVNRKYIDRLMREEARRGKK